MLLTHFPNDICLERQHVARDISMKFALGPGIQIPLDQLVMAPGKESWMLHGAEISAPAWSSPSSTFIADSAV